MDERAILPPGYGCLFKPSDEKLINLLWRKSKNLPLPPNPIIERDLYNETAFPWTIFGDQDPFWQDDDSESNSDSRKRFIYVFTKTKKSGKGRCNRTVGTGTWHGETGQKKVRNSKGQVIGIRKDFVFEMEQTKNMQGHWIMHELSLEESFLHGIPWEDQYVVCRISRDDKKVLRRKPMWRKKASHTVAESLLADSASSHNVQQLGKRMPLPYHRQGQDMPQANNTFELTKETFEVPQSSISENYILLKECPDVLECRTSLKQEDNVSEWTVEELQALCDNLSPNLPNQASDSMCSQHVSADDPTIRAIPAAEPLDGMPNQIESDNDYFDLDTILRPEEVEMLAIDQLTRVELPHPQLYSYQEVDDFWSSTQV